MPTNSVSSSGFPACSHPTILDKKTVLFATAKEKRDLKNNKIQAINRTSLVKMETKSKAQTKELSGISHVTLIIMGMTHRNDEATRKDVKQNPC